MFFVDANYLQREQMIKEKFSETNIATSVKLQLPPSLHNCRPLVNT